MVGHGTARGRIHCVQNRFHTSRRICKASQWIAGGSQERAGKWREPPRYARTYLNKRRATDTTLHCKPPNFTQRFISRLRIVSSLTHILRCCTVLCTYLAWGAVGHAQLQINEVCSKNYRSAEDSFGHHTDWIELHNVGTSAVQLGQYYLSDRFYEPSMWRIASTAAPSADSFSPRRGA